ncbi:hypothetical protein KBD08_02765 [Candidatus Babeliales bacterium]|nr:hypothetical protein [Candidatus Babeliales bacterium]
MKIYLLLSIICITSLAYASRDVKVQSVVANTMDAFGQSKFIHLYSKYVQTAIDRCMMSYGDLPASQIYQDLGLQAQQALGIAPECQVPIKKIKTPSLLHAVAGSDGIYVNEELLKNKSLGALRCAMFHEAVHVKYHDAAALGLFKVTGLLLGYVATYKTLGMCGVTTFHKGWSVVAGALASVGFSFKYRQFMERRADTQGHQAVNCASCVQEEIEQRTNMYETATQTIFQNMPEEQRRKIQSSGQNLTESIENIECMQGYLRRCELEQIKQSLGDKKCSNHLEHHGKVH